MLTAEYVRTLLDYNLSNGEFRWRYRKNSSNSWNSRYAEILAGTFDKDGYRVIKIDRKSYKAHRLAWLIVSGSWPVYEIDHKDGNRSNNAWTNLREATHAQNSRNYKTPVNNTSGIKGVYWHKECRKWMAKITVNAKLKHLGVFDTIEEATQMRLAAELEVYGEFRRCG